MDSGIEHYAHQIDSLVGRLDALIELQQNRNHFVVTQKQEGLGGWNIAAVCACFFTMFALIIALIVIIPEVHDLRAWRDIHSAKIARLEAAQDHK